MSTATKVKPTSVTAELERLEEAKAEAKAKVEAVRAEVEAADANLTGLERMRGSNPHTPDHQRARAESRRCREALELFKVTRISDRLVELGPEQDAAEQAIRDAAGALVEACEQYRVGVEKTKAIVSITPPLERGSEPSLAFDPRVSEWQKIAANIVDAEEISRPGLSAIAIWKLANYMEKHDNG